MVLRNLVPINTVKIDHSGSHLYPIFTVSCPESVVQDKWVEPRDKRFPNRYQCLVKRTFVQYCLHVNLYSFLFMSCSKTAPPIQAKRVSVTVQSELIVPVVSGNRFTALVELTWLFLHARLIWNWIYHGFISKHPIQNLLSESGSAGLFGFPRLDYSRPKQIKNSGWEQK